MACGTATAATVTPATRSAPASPARYSRSTPSAGTARPIQAVALVNDPPAGGVPSPEPDPLASRSWRAARRGRMMARVPRLQRKNFALPDQVRDLGNGRLDVIGLDEISI